MQLHPDRLFPSNPATRQVARALYESIKMLPILSPHGHTDPKWFALNEHFSNPVEVFIKPDHYVFRMLYSQGIGLDQLGIEGATLPAETDLRKIWRLFCAHYYLFRGTPSRFWLDHAFYEVCGVDREVTSDNADAIYDQLMAVFAQDDFKPRALLDRFSIEFLATTESPLDDLKYHQMINETALKGRVVTTFRPDCVTDPDYENFVGNIATLGKLTDSDITCYADYLAALRTRRLYFKTMGAVATDHGHPTAKTANLSKHECETLFKRVCRDDVTAQDAELFRAQMLTEMAIMSVEDGLVMQIHSGSYRNHSRFLFDEYGRDKGADIPMRTEFVHALKPMLDVVGTERDLRIILFTLDETTYTRELAPLVGVYPCLRLGPAWWFMDSVEGMRRYKKRCIETAGFYNTAGFNDDTRAFLSIPARHDMARRIDCGCLAELVVEHQISESDAFEIAEVLTGSLVKQSYKLESI
ncbi:MAG: glucuronate isomerase [Coxiella sp. (in: Bacteria)]|nr:MAG: glucuronate isomerase [Coxiella sp. (in: g-proteobacteria)]